MASSCCRPMKTRKSHRNGPPVPQMLQKTDQQESPSVNISYMSLEALCRMKQPVVKLLNLDTKFDHQEKKRSNKLDSKQYSDQKRHKTDQQKDPSVTISSTSECKWKEPVVKLICLETPLNHQGKKQSSELSKQYSDQVSSPSNSEAHEEMALSSFAQKEFLSPNTDFARKPDQQKCGPETLGLKYPVIQCTRLNIKADHQIVRQARIEGDSTHHHDHVQPPDSAPLNVQPEYWEEQEDEEEDSDEFDKQVSAYERERLKNIKANEQFLKSLKLLEVGSTLRLGRKKYTPRIKRQHFEIKRHSVRLKGTIPSEKVLQMLPADNVDHGAWISFQDTWKSISTNEFPKPTHCKYSKITSYANSLKKMTLNKRTGICTLPGCVSSIAIHPSNTHTLVAAGDSLGNVVLWDQNHQSPGLYTFPLYSQETRCVAFPPSNSKHLLSLGLEGRMLCGDVTRSVFDEVFNMERDLTSFDFLSDDGSVLLVSHYKSQLSVVDRRTPTYTSNVSGHLHLVGIRSVNVHPLKRELCVVASLHGNVIYDVRKLSMIMTKPVLSLQEGISCVSASFSPATGKNVLTLFWDSTLRVFGIKDFKQNANLVSTIMRPKRMRYNCFAPAAWDPRQENCLAEGRISKGQINIRHMKGQIVKTLLITGTPSAIAMHPTRNLLAAGMQDTRSLCVWKEQTN
ncbi:WD repeat-containing protein 76 isoform X2 [Dendropsophus ebraccatus]|uniref:WD repeat-containing protein 76 isoform X2 n=1 Tax=Dendropsophus ebraccatus TaxID=150705 RepID=UPI003831D3F3